MKFTRILCTIGLLATSSAFAGTGLSVVVGPSLGMPNFNPSQSTISGHVTFPTGGLLFDVGSNVGVELGALYSVEGYGDSTGTLSHRGFQFPAQLKLALGPIFNVGVGGFFTDYTNFCATVNGVGICATPNVTSNYGPMASVGLNLGTFVATVRYTLGLHELSTDPTQSLKLSSLSALLGYRFGI